VFILWVVPVLAQSPPAPTFEQQVRQVLRAHLQKAEELPVGELLDELARETKLPREQVRARLSVWLDTLEAWRREKRGEWEKLVKSGGAQTSAREAEKFLRQFAGQARRALEKQADRPLEELVEEAAQKAQVLTYQGRDLLLRLLSEEERGPLPDKVGLLVEVRNRIEDDHGIWSHRNAAGEWVMVSGANLHEFLLPVLVEELGQSPRARWALDHPKPGLPSDWRLVLELERLDWGNGAGLLLIGQVVLVELKSQEELYRRPVQVKFTYEEDLDPKDRAAKFLGEIALKTRGIFEECWDNR
jgi:hypothetical protein